MYVHILCSQHSCKYFLNYCFIPTLTDVYSFEIIFCCKTNIFLWRDTVTACFILCVVEKRWIQLKKNCNIGFLQCFNVLRLLSPRFLFCHGGGVKSPTLGWPIRPRFHIFADPRKIFILMNTMNGLVTVRLRVGVRNRARLGLEIYIYDIF